MWLRIHASVWKPSVISFSPNKNVTCCLKYLLWCWTFRLSCHLFSKQVIWHPQKWNELETNTPPLNVKFDRYWDFCLVEVLRVLNASMLRRKGLTLKRNIHIFFKPFLPSSLLLSLFRRSSWQLPKKFSLPQSSSKLHNLFSLLT